MTPAADVTADNISIIAQINKSMSLVIVLDTYVSTVHDGLAACVIRYKSILASF